MNTAQQQSAVELARAFGFRTETRSQAEIDAAYNADKARREAKRKYNEALRLDRLADIAEREREARELAEALANNRPVRVRTQQERLVSRQRAEEEAGAARHLKGEIEEGKVNVVKEVPLIAPEVLAAGLAADRAEDERRRAEREQREAKVAQHRAEREQQESERVRRLAETVEEDRAREAERVEREKLKRSKHQALLAEGLRADREATARSRAIGISKSDDMSPDEKHGAMLEAGFTLSSPASAERDARYTHRETGLNFYLRGTALGMVDVVRPHKPRGSELIFKKTEVSNEERMSLHERNRKAEEERQEARRAANKRKAEEQLAKKERGYKVMAPKVKAEKKPTDGKKSKKGGK